jgi:hypothetical protein
MGAAERRDATGLARARPRGEGAAAWLLGTAMTLLAPGAGGRRCRWW